jgi:hypothetical protein
MELWVQEAAYKKFIIDNREYEDTLNLECAYEKQHHRSMVRDIHSIMKTVIDVRKYILSLHVI